MYNLLMDTTHTLPACDVAADILFAKGSGEFTQTTPMLRYCAGLTWGTETTRQAFIAAVVAAGYNATTAGVCWSAGRNFMRDLEST